MIRSLRRRLAGQAYALARHLDDLARWLAAPYIPPRDPDAVAAGRAAFLDAGAANFGEGQARKQLAAGLIAEDLATGAKVGRRTNGNGHHIDNTMTDDDQ